MNPWLAFAFGVVTLPLLGVLLSLWRVRHEDKLDVGSKERKQMWAKEGVL